MLLKQRFKHTHVHLQSICLLATNIWIPVHLSPQEAFWWCHYLNTVLYPLPPQRCLCPRSCVCRLFESYRCRFVSCTLRASSWWHSTPLSTPVARATLESNDSSTELCSSGRHTGRRQKQHFYSSELADMWLLSDVDCKYRLFLDSDLWNTMHFWYSAVLSICTICMSLCIKASAKWIQFSVMYSTTTTSTTHTHTLHNITHTCDTQHYTNTSQWCPVYLNPGAYYSYSTMLCYSWIGQCTGYGCILTE